NRLQPPRQARLQSFRARADNPTIQERIPIPATVSAARQRISLPQSPLYLFSPDDQRSWPAILRPILRRRNYLVGQRGFAALTPACWLPSKFFSIARHQNNHARKIRRKTQQVFLLRCAATSDRS